MTIKDISPDTVIKLGYTEGSGYLYCGSIQDAGIEAIDEICKTAAERAVEDTRRRIKKVLQDKREKGEKEEITAELAAKLERAEKYLREYVPIAEREIYDSYPSLLEDATIILYEGMELGHSNKHMVNEEDRPIVIGDDAAAYRLLGAIFKGIYDDLRKDYVAMFGGSETRKKTAIERQKMKRQAERKEEQTPPYLIRIAREKAIEWLCRDVYINRKYAEDCIRNLKAPRGTFERRPRLTPKDIRKLPVGTRISVMKPMDKDYYDYVVDTFKSAKLKRKILRSVKPLNGEYLRLEIKHYGNTEYVLTEMGTIG